MPGSEFSANERLAELIAEACDQAPQSIVSRRACSGGCIHQAEIVELSEGGRYFVKSSRDAAEMFVAEAAGLQALSSVGSIRVPRVIALGRLEGQCDCLILEAIELGRQGSKFFDLFGDQFAQLHQLGIGDQHGWETDNYIGSTVQQNQWHDEWISFFAECRLEFQLRLAQDRGLANPELTKLGRRLVQRLDERLACDSEPACLLHGDLWSGNFAADSHGDPVIFDPAVYYGHRESDLAMPLLFGGFPASFFEAYNARSALQPGWRSRVEIYQLYHLLNHLNLFGSSYLSSCLEILRRVA